MNSLSAFGILAQNAGDNPSFWAIAVGFMLVLTGLIALFLLIFMIK